MLSQVQPEDLIHFGMIPEFVGRLPCTTALNSLDEKAMVRILTDPRNALVKQYQRFFQMENASLEFTADSLVAIAKKAMVRDVGARALRAVVEELMLDIMFELPEQKDQGDSYEITGDMVDGSRPTIFTARQRKKESA